MIKIFKRLLFSSIVGATFLGACSIACAAGSSTMVGRYLTVANHAETSQIDPLTQTIQVKLPSHVKTVGDAIEHLLRFSSYRLIDKSQLTPEVANLLKLPLPQSVRNLGPVTLKDGLLTLAGQPFGLLVDPVHRLVSFHLLPVYASLY